MKYYLVMNPGSRGGRSGKRFEAITSFFEKSGLGYDTAITRDLDDAWAKSRWANEDGSDVVIAVGGDGTINRVLNGFYDGNGRRISKAKKGVVYTGTSPDFCASYGIPYNDLDAALETVVKGRTRSVRVGRIELSPRVGSKPSETRYFACCVNIGLGAALARRANGGIRKILGDRAGTFLSLIWTLMTYRANSLPVTRDGKRKVLDRLYNMSVGRTHHIASGIKVKNELTDDDIRFYCMVVRNINLTNVFRCLRAVYSGNDIANGDIVSLDYCRTVSVKANENNPEVEFDGDPQGYLPCKISLAQDKLDLVVNDE